MRIGAHSVSGSQDTPAVKSTYTARVRVPAPLTALMSAVPVGKPHSSGDTTKFAFEQKAG